MAENSVNSYINAQPEQAMSFQDYYEQYTGYKDFDADHPFASIENFFTGNRDKAKSEYEAYLTNLNNRNEYLATQSARAWQEYMDSTKIQRLMKDYEKAGLNPYLAINDNGLSGSSLSGAKASYGYKHKDNSDDNGAKGRNFALIILALAKVAAALL